MKYSLLLYQKVHSFLFLFSFLSLYDKKKPHALPWYNWSNQSFLITYAHLFTTPVFTWWYYLSLISNDRIMQWRNVCWYYIYYSILIWKLSLKSPNRSLKSCSRWNKAVFKSLLSLPSTNFLSQNLYQEKVLFWFHVIIWSLPDLIDYTIPAWIALAMHVHFETHIYSN